MRHWIALFAANLNALAYDFVARQKVQGQHLNWFIVEQLPIVPPAAYASAFGPKAAAEIVREAVLELSYIVSAQETAKWGSYRSRDLCLAWINALMAGQPDAEIGG